VVDKIPTPITQAAKLVKEYEYGLAVHGRFEPKDFRWRLPDGTYEKGLGSKVKVKDLPLYNVALGDDPAIPVYLTEGEKAADACLAVGLLATCQAGGAAAKDFGGGFAALQGRHVILWPDRDEQGLGLMRRIEGALQGIAASVRFISPPGMPPKGDAFDYFGAGGTVAALEAMLKAQPVEPAIEAIFDGYLVTLPDAGGYVRWQFTELSAGRGLDAELEVWQEIPGYTQEHFQASLNLKSNSNRETFRRQLDAMFGGEINWTAKLNRACQMVKETYRAEDPAILLYDADEPQVDYLYPPFLAADGVTIIFGAGGSGKTMFALWLALHLDRPGLYVDYEASGGVLKRRMRRLLAGLGRADTIPPLLYWPARGRPLADMKDALRAKIHHSDVEFVVVDSALLACGGNPLDSETVIKFFNALAALGVPVMLISHVTKEDDVNGTKYPFGSVVWSNSARLTWNIRTTKEPGRMVLGLFGRKVNEDEDTARTAAFAVTFEPECFTFAETDYRQAGDLADEIPLRDRIWALLAEGDYTPSEIAAGLGVPLKSARNRLTEMKKALRVLGNRNGEQVWGRPDTMR
jgi:hypothetical protein